MSKKIYKPRHLEMHEYVHLDTYVYVHVYKCLPQISTLPDQISLGVWSKAKTKKQP